MLFGFSSLSCHNSHPRLNTVRKPFLLTPPLASMLLVMKNRFPLLQYFVLHLLLRMTTSLSTSMKSHESSATTTTPESTTTDSSSPSSTNTKILFGIRHAHSEANEWMSRPGNEWGDATFTDDPSLVDAVLSQKGLAQVQNLASRLAAPAPNDESSNNNDRSQGAISDVERLLTQQVELVVVSPLTRCLQTWELGCSKAFVQAKSQARMPLVLAHPLATERVYTSSDTGRSIPQLENDFPDVDFSECHKFANQQGSEWWYTAESDDDDDDDVGAETGAKGPEKELSDEWRPHGEGQYYAVPGEPFDAFDERMKRLQSWLLKRPEKCILVVCHWGVLRYLTSGQSVENCGVIKMQIGSDTTNPN